MSEREKYSECWIAVARIEQEVCEHERTRAMTNCPSLIPMKHCPRLYSAGGGMIPELESRLTKGLGQSGPKLQTPSLCSAVAQWWRHLKLLSTSVLGVVNSSAPGLCQCNLGGQDLGFPLLCHQRGEIQQAPLGCAKQVRLHTQQER